MGDISSFFEKRDDIGYSISMSVSDFSDVRDFVVMNEFEFTDSESGKDRVIFHDEMVIN